MIEETNIEEPLLNYEYDRKLFLCSSCFNHKPLSAMKEVNSKKLWCISCHDKMLECKAKSHGEAQSARWIKHKGQLEDYRNGKRKTRPIL